MMSRVVRADCEAKVKKSYESVSLSFLSSLGLNFFGLLLLFSMLKSNIVKVGFLFFFLVSLAVCIIFRCLDYVMGHVP